MTIIKSKLSMTCAFLFLFLALVFCVGAAPAHAEPAPGATDAILTFQLTEFPDEYRNDVTVSITNTDTGDTYDITAHYVGTYTNTLHVLKGHYQITGVDIHDYNNVGYALTLDPGGTLLDETDGFDVTGDVTLTGKLVSGVYDNCGEESTLGDTGVGVVDDPVTPDTPGEPEQEPTEPDQSGTPDAGQESPDEPDAGQASPDVPDAVPDTGETLEGPLGTVALILVIIAVACIAAWIWSSLRNHMQQ